MAKKRDEILKKDKWNVEAIFQSDQIWEENFHQIESELSKINQFKGHLAESAEIIGNMYRTTEDLDLRLNKLYTYAHMKHDEDTKNDFYRTMQERIYSLSVNYEEMASWITPELMAIDETVLDRYIQSDTLAPYRFDLQKIIRKKKHILSDNEERILSLSGLPLSATGDAFRALTDADLKFPMVKDGQGKDLELTHATYQVYLHSQDRELRKNAWITYHQKYDEFATTLSSLLQGEIRSHVFYAKARGYQSALDAALFGNNIDRSVYLNLIKTVRDNKASLQNYLAYRTKKMGLDKLHFYDLYVPFIEYQDLTIPYEDAKQQLFEAVKPLGEEYLAAIQKGLNDEGWVDIYENENKRSGAYSTGSYLTQPYILMNYNNTLDSGRTLAHEAGHSMHSYFTHSYQTPTYGHYPIFLAEVASTFNEELFNDYLLKKSKDRKLQAYIINSMIEDIRATLFRQTMFAEFELKIHELVETGTPLTAELLKKEYRALYEFYYGDYLLIDEELEIEWARIPHFYYNYYVYQYATGISAAISLFKRVTGGGEQERNDYLGFLKAGCSKFPVDILKDAGVDMQSPAPIEAAIRHFDFLLAELKKREGDL